MLNRVITISREFGSGGRTIGKRVAEKLGIPCYDAELIQMIAEESGYAADYIKEEGEYATGGWLSTVFTDRTMGLTNQDKLWSIQSRVYRGIGRKRHVCNCRTMRRLYSAWQGELPECVYTRKHR